MRLVKLLRFLSSRWNKDFVDGVISGKKSVRQSWIIKLIRSFFSLRFFFSSLVSLDRCCTWYEDYSDSKNPQMKRVNLSIVLPCNEPNQLNSKVFLPYPNVILMSNPLRCRLLWSCKLLSPTDSHSQKYQLISLFIAKYLRSF